MTAIEVEGLTKAYGDTVGIRDVTFQVQDGEIFGYLGPNGAGKTTTIRTLLGLISPTSGDASVLGHDVRTESEFVRAKRRIGYLPDTLGFEGNVTGRRILDYHASVKGDPRRDDLLERFRPPLDRTVRDYSHGNRRMLGIVQAFMHDPDLVIMDEPTSGLDPIKKEQFHEFLLEEGDRGTTVFFSSHVLSEVRRVCSRVGILRDGCIAALEEMDSLMRRRGKRVRVQFAEPVERAALDEPGIVDPVGTGEVWQFTYTGDYNDLLGHLSWFDVVDIEIAEPPIEDVFLHYYGDADSDAGDRSASGGGDGEGDDAWGDGQGDDDRGDGLADV